MSCLSKQSNKKRGQVAATQTAVFVLVMGLLIVLYVFFVSNDVREELLEDNSSDNYGNNVNYHYEKVLLRENIGHLDYLNLDEYEFTLPSFSLIATTQSKILFENNNFYIRSNWFKKKTKTIDVSLPNYENLENVILNFNSNTREGILIIKFNGEVIFEDKLRSVNSNPIKINKDLLLKENKLEFEVSSVGASFWKTNEFSIQNLKIRGDLEDLSKQKSNNYFTLSKEQFDNLESAELMFLPACQIDDIGILNIELNGNLLTSSIPDCGAPFKIDIPKENLKQGRNLLFFRAEKGIYQIDQISIDILLKEASKPKYYFDISEKQFDELYDEEKKLNLSFKFIDNGEDKEAEIMFNGHKTYIETRDERFSKIIIKEWIERKNNYIMISPQTTMDIVELKLEIQNADDNIEDFDYFCNEDNITIMLDHNRNIEDTTWECSFGENCEGNYVSYSEEKSRSVVRNAICEEN